MEATSPGLQSSFAMAEQDLEKDILAKARKEQTEHAMVVVLVYKGATTVLNVSRNTPIYSSIVQPMNQKCGIIGYVVYEQTTLDITKTPNELSFPTVAKLDLFECPQGLTPVVEFLEKGPAKTPLAITGPLTEFPFPPPAEGHFLVLILIGRDLKRFHVHSFGRAGELRKKLASFVADEVSYLTWNGYQVIDDTPLAALYNCQFTKNNTIFLILWGSTKPKDSQPPGTLLNPATSSALQGNPALFPGMMRMNPGFNMGLPQGLTPQTIMQAAQVLAAGYPMMQGMNMMSFPFQGFPGNNPFGFTPFLFPNMNQNQFDPMGNISASSTPVSGNVTVSTPQADKVASTPSSNDAAEKSHSEKALPAVSAPPGFETDLLKFHNTTGTIPVESLEKFPREIVKENRDVNQARKLSTSEPPAWSKTSDPTVTVNSWAKPAAITASAPPTSKIPDLHYAQAPNDLEEGEIRDDWSSPSAMTGGFDAEDISLRRETMSVEVRKGKKGTSFADAVKGPNYGNLDARTNASNFPDLGSNAKPNGHGGDLGNAPKPAPPAPLKDPLNLQYRKTMSMGDDFSRPKVTVARPTLSHEKAKQLSAKVVEREIMKDPVGVRDDSAPKLATWGDVRSAPQKSGASKSAWDTMNDNIGVDHEMGKDPQAGKYGQLRRDFKNQQPPHPVKPMAPAPKVGLAKLKAVDKNAKKNKKTRLPKIGGGSKKDEMETFMKQKAEEAAMNSKRRASEADIKKVLTVPDEWARGRLMRVLNVTKEDIDAYLNKDLIASPSESVSDDDFSSSDESPQSPPPRQPSTLNGGEADGLVNNANPPEDWESLAAEEAKPSEVKEEAPNLSMSNPSMSDTEEYDFRPKVATSLAGFAQMVVVNENTGSVNVTWLPIPRKKAGSELSVTETLDIVKPQLDHNQNNDENKDSQRSSSQPGSPGAPTVNNHFDVDGWTVVNKKGKGGNK